MNENTFLYLSRKDVEGVNMVMTDIINALEDMFKEKGEGRVEMPPKPGIHTRKDAFIHAMPAYIPKLQSAGMKWVSGYPDNQKMNLPYISGLLILNDPDNGFPIAVMDATWITAMRTGAATAVAAKYLARPDSSSVGIIACGVQGRSNLEALSSLFEINKVKAFDISPQAAELFAIEMEEVIKGEIEIVNDPRDAVVGLDLVVTSGPILRNPDPVVEAGWLSEGSFASLVDFDSYFKADALREADKLATDDKNQMLSYREHGYFKDTPQPYADLGEIAAGKKPGRENSNERTICINLGLALADMATAIVIYKKAREKELGIQLPL
jgi:ornithine cyclodeaminase/alanine dehydrogenase